MSCAVGLFSLLFAHPRKSLLSLIGFYMKAIFHQRGSCVCSGSDRTKLGRESCVLSVAKMESREQAAMVEIMRVKCCNLEVLGMIPNPVLEYL